jgi:hypothetical protein
VIDREQKRECLDPPDDLAPRLLVDTLAAEVTQAEDTLTRRQKRLNDALVKVYDSYTPRHDEHPQSTVGENSIPTWVWVIWVCLMILGASSIAYSICYRFPY